jgi:hypothetical protein
VDQGREGGDRSGGVADDRAEREAEQRDGEEAEAGGEQCLEPSA